MIVIPLFLCWGSFLNVLGYRLINQISIIFPRSFCPQCTVSINWYDNIPAISWVILLGKCRHCRKRISILYPIIELLTTIIMSLLYFWVPPTYFIPYFIFFSALLVTIRTDLEFMLISDFATIFLIPLGFLFSITHLLPITLSESILAAVIGYSFLFSIRFFFQLITGKEGMGKGDLGLIAFIGSFTGLIGCWISLLIGSLTGSIIGLGYQLIYQPQEQVKIPFGPFLAGGAIIFVLFQESLVRLFIT